MQPPGLRLPRSPPLPLTLLAARQHLFEGFNKSSKHAWYLTPATRCLTFTGMHRRRGLLKTSVATMPPQNMTQAATAATTSMRIPVKHWLTPRPNKICNDPPDTPEHGQHGHARDSNNVRAPNIRHGQGYSQELVITLNNCCAFQPVVLAENPLPPRQGHKVVAWVAIVDKVSICRHYQHRNSVRIQLAVALAVAFGSIIALVAGRRRSNSPVYCSLLMDASLDQKPGHSTLLIYRTL